MAYDRAKVVFTDEEHKAAEAADAIFEALADGLQLAEDVPVLFSPAIELFGYLAKSGSKEAYADKLSDLAIMLKRDNWNADEAEEPV